MATTSHTNNNNALLEGSILAVIHRLAVPMLISALLQNLQTLIDLFWVGRLGPHAIAGVALSGVVVMLLLPGLMGLSTGTVAMVARAIGAGDLTLAGTAAAQSILLGCLMGLLIAGLGWWPADALLRLLGTGADVMPAASVYLKISMVGTVTVFILFIGSAALQGSGDSVTPMYIMAVSNVLNMVLDPLFIFGLGIMPPLGVAGAAIATICAQALAAALLMVILLRGRGQLHLRRPCWRPNIGLAWRIVRIGIPGSGQMLSRSLMGAVIMRIVARCGTTAVAAYGTGLRFHMIILMPAFALGGAAATLVGQNLGALRPARAHRVAWAATALDIGFMLVSATIMYLFAPQLIGVFNSDPEVVKIGTEYLRVVSPFYIFAAPGIVLSRALQGAGDTFMPMVITILTLWGVQVPVASWLSRVWQPPTVGIWTAMAAAFVMQAVLTIGWFETGRWKKIKV